MTLAKTWYHFTLVLAAVILSVCPSVHGVCHDPVPIKDQVR